MLFWCHNFIALTFGKRSERKDEVNTQPSIKIITSNRFVCVYPRVKTNYTSRSFKHYIPNTTITYASFLQKVM